MRRRLLVLGILTATVSSILGWQLSEGAGQEPEMTTLTVLVPVSQIQGEMVAYTLGGQPVIDCDQLVNLFGLHLNAGPSAGTVPCHLDVAVNR